MKSKFLVLIAAAALITGCTTMLKPTTVADAVIVHSTFPSLSLAVLECVEDYPEVRAEIVTPFNSLVDKWQLFDGASPEDIAIDVAGSKQHFMQAKMSWVSIKKSIVDADIDCGDIVTTQVNFVETTFDDIMEVINSNERVVYALEWGSLLNSILRGQSGRVVKIS